MAIRQVREMGDEILTKQCKPVPKMTLRTKILIGDMLDTMYEALGVGLAAPQVDSAKSMFVIDMRRRLNPESPCRFTIDGKELPMDIAMPLFAVNPKVEEIGEYVEVGEEGCLSFPGIYAEVERSYQAKLNYQDLDGAEHELICEGLFARCVQHENDHLNGICFVDRLEPKELFKIATKLRKLRKQTKDFLKHKDK